MFRDELKYIYNFLTVIKKHFPSYSQIYTVAKWLKNYLQTRQSFEQVSYNSKHERETWLEEGARGWAGGHGSSTAAPAAGDAPTAGVGSTASGLGGWRKALAVSEAEHQQSFYLWCVCACVSPALKTPLVMPKRPKSAVQMRGAGLCLLLPCCTPKVSLQSTAHSAPFTNRTPWTYPELSTDELAWERLAPNSTLVKATSPAGPCPKDTRPAPHAALLLLALSRSTGEQTGLAPGFSPSHKVCPPVHTFPFSAPDSPM